MHHKGIFPLHTPHSNTPHFTVHSTLHTLYFTLLTPHFTLLTLHTTLHTLHTTLYTFHSRLHTLHFTLHTPHSTLYTPHSTLYTPHFTLYTRLSCRFAWQAWHFVTFQTCLITCRKYPSWRKSRTKCSFFCTHVSRLESLVFLWRRRVYGGSSALHTLHFTLHTPQFTL